MAALAQAQKCQIDGKTVYSDTECGQAGVSVNVRQNTIETSALRAQIANDKATATAAERRAKAIAVKVPSGKPGPCDHIKYAGAGPTNLEAERKIECMNKASREYRRP